MHRSIDDHILVCMCIHSTYPRHFIGTQCIVTRADYDDIGVELLQELDRLVHEVWCVRLPVRAPGKRDVEDVIVVASLSS